MTADALADAERRAVWLRLALGVSTLLMLGLSWPLWIAHGDLPMVPFAGGLPVLRRPWSDALAMGVAGSLMAGMFAAVRGSRTTAWDVISLVGFVALVIQDQNRLQPWVYQSVMLTLALAACRSRWALWLSRLFLIALYVHSGLSKLDASFASELGPHLLGGLFRPAGVMVQSWRRGTVFVLALLMPAVEVLAGAGLALRRVRRFGLALAISIHAVLIGILGPWGLGHSAIVLAWNVALVVELVVLFTGPGPGRDGGPRSPACRAVTGLFVVACVMPCFERWGYWDTWPAFAFYASHTERTQILLHDADLAGYPPELLRHLGASTGEPWRRLDLTGWSRSERGVPVYPQGRVANAIAESLAGWGGRRRLVLLRQWGRADRWTGRREFEQRMGLDAIRERGDRYWINGHPARMGR
jgi:hypothetical protein